MPPALWPSPRQSAIGAQAEYITPSLYSFSPSAAGEPLAGGVAVEVDDEGVDGLDVRVRGPEGLPFAQRSDSAGCVFMHDFLTW